ncbi:NAD(P)-dependent oxidoreductase, partial [Aeromicrobium sp.]|uniref:NAD(P)-dependent oxidoreductase n=1 Tax=Aeromicrobium sp. TaxID=1871063 RepID=UPI0028AD634B
MSSPSPQQFPLGLRLEGRRVLVVGGGHVATRRAFSLLEARADVHVVSPEVSESLASA